MLEISHYWSRVPPLHEAFASFFGLIKSTPVFAEATSMADGVTEVNDTFVHDLRSLGISLPAGFLD